MYTAAGYVNLAAPSAGTQLLGSVGAGGAALVMTVILILGIRGKGKIHLTHDSAVITGFIAGQLYAMAGGVWTAPGNMSDGLAQAVQQGFGSGGNVGMGAIALCMGVIAYGSRLKPFPASVLGILTAPIFAAAGASFAIVTTVLSSGLNQLIG
ncbi:hypothetical protein [Streptomyces anulatus]|uniref:hypothetical protein n=1 Tax=Streptomyces anulatus TaxID=1892 RepID=UPI001C27EAD7|nr:hypothetical protein [Streptomyces anulatus]